MIDFEPTEEQRLIQSSIADFAKAHLFPRAREFEKLRAVPDDVQKLAHEIGIPLLALPEEVGGQAIAFTTRVLIDEELGAADVAAAFGFGGAGAFATALVELGNADQIRDYLRDFAIDPSLVGAA